MPCRCQIALIGRKLQDNREGALLHFEGVALLVISSSGGIQHLYLTGSDLVGMDFTHQSSQRKLLHRCRSRLYQSARHEGTLVVGTESLALENARASKREAQPRRTTRYTKGAGDERPC